MFDENIVSIIVPCFNGERYIEKCFNSILEQTYREIQFIFCDDGSSDASYEKAISWEPKFLNKGINLFV